VIVDAGGRHTWGAAAAAARCVLAGLLLTGAGGCESAREVQLRREVVSLRDQVQKTEHRLAAQQAALDELKQQLTVARGLSEEDLQKLYYPERLEIDPQSGGADYDGKPGDDGVTVYLRPVDREGDAVKVPGDITIQLYDLAAPPGANLVGEYKVPVDQVGRLWHGKFLARHYTIKCPWPSVPPAHSELTIRALFVDYLTKRVVSAQTTCQVDLPPK
jgi:hypothetical protein